MQSSNGKNRIELNLTLNQIVFFSGELPITSSYTGPETEADTQHLLVNNNTLRS